MQVISLYFESLLKLPIKGRGAELCPHPPPSCFTFSSMNHFVCVFLYKMCGVY